MDATLAQDAERHLAACEDCSAVHAEWGAVFDALATPGRLAPASGFADHVIARARKEGVEITAAPVPSAVQGLVHPAGAPIRTTGRVRKWAGQLVARLRTTGGRRWPVLAGIGTAPAAVVATLGWVVFTHPLVTTSGLAQYLWFKSSQVVEGAVSAFLGGASGTPAFSLLTQALQSAASAPGLAALGLVSLLAVTSGSIWVLYRNLGLGRDSMIPARLGRG